MYICVYLNGAVDLRDTGIMLLWEAYRFVDKSTYSATIIRDWRWTTLDPVLYCEVESGESISGDFMNADASN